MHTCVPPIAVTASEREGTQREACLRVVLADDSYLVREALLRDAPEASQIRGYANVRPGFEHA